MKRCIIKNTVKWAVSSVHIIPMLIGLSWDADRRREERLSALWFILEKGILQRRWDAFTSSWLRRIVQVQGESMEGDKHGLQNRKLCLGIKRKKKIL